MAPTKGFRGIIVMLAVAWLAAGCDYVRPFEQVCERRLGRSSIRVEAPPTQLQHDFTHTTGALTIRGAAHVKGSNRVVDGLTEASLTSSVSVGGNGVVKPLSGRFCTRPEVRVTLAYRPMTVFVASEHKPGTCGHDLTLNHEMKHVRVYERFIDELTGEIETGLRTMLGEQIHYFPSAVEGDLALNAMVNEKVGAMIRNAMRNVQQRQAGVDSPEEYDRLDLMQSKCSG